MLGGYDPSRYRVEVTQATASDGVKVPIWMVYRKDLMKKDGTKPALFRNEANDYAYLVVPLVDRE